MSAGSQQDLFASRKASEPAHRRPSWLRIGTSGYSYSDWVGRFYPEGMKRSGMLEFYQRSFDTVEINATYYRIPPPSTMKRMAERTREGFHFMVKVPGPLTHRRKEISAPAEAFLRAIEPMQKAGKFAGALAQFPFSFRRTRENEDYLASLRQTLPEIPLFIEFRHESWDTPDIERFLEAIGCGFCSVDEPELPGLIPRRAGLAGSIAYVRFHGRNAKAWWGGGSERYNYLYTEDELRDWADTIEQLAQRADLVYVFFNNCHAGHAVVNARMLEQMLSGEGAP